jgi:hypothetical protein
VMKGILGLSTEKTSQELVWWMEKKVLR